MPSIFVSYRRSDAPGHAGRLYDRLVDRLGEDNVFMDLDSMEPGADFGEVIEETVARCDALVAVIGRDWLAVEEGGRPRLHSPEDWVRLEIGNALKRQIRVIPVLVQGARMPSAGDLPADLHALARRHAVELSDNGWNLQVRHLVDRLDRLGANAGLGTPQAPPEAAAHDREALEPRPKPGDFVMSTSEGDVILETFDEDAPVSVANFLQLAEIGFYDGLIFR